MRRSILLAIILAFSATLAGCALDMGQDARFGVFGGRQREAKPEPPFDIKATKFGARWFVTHLRWAPDDSHLLASLCHVERDEYCRIGKYWIAEKRWELLPLKPQTTYRWPSYSPDGQHIVVTVGACNANYRCPDDDWTLSLLSPDGKSVTALIRSRAKQATFSDDGKKIIYWRYTGGGGVEVAMFDLESSREHMLTYLPRWGTATLSGAPYFLPGGERFVFSGELQIHATGDYVKQEGKIVYKDGQPVKVPHPLAGSKLDPAGPNRGVIRYVWDRRRGPVTRQNVAQVELLWPDNELAAINDGAMDVSRKGEVLYHIGARYYLAKQKVAGYKANVVPVDTRPESSSQVLMLRPAREDAQDTAAFVLRGAQMAAVSSDSRRLAFVENSPLSWHPTHRVGIVSLDRQTPDYIDWPRMELDSAATQTLSPTK